MEGVTLSTFTDDFGETMSQVVRTPEVKATAELPSDMFVSAGGVHTERV